MSIIKFIKRIFRKKPVYQNIHFTVVGGIDCPKCGVGGLFKEDNGYRCEECLTNFDENKSPLN